MDVGVALYPRYFISFISYDPGSRLRRKDGPNPSGEGTQDSALRRSSRDPRKGRPRCQSYKPFLSFSRGGLGF